MKSLFLGVAANIAANTAIQAGNNYRNSERVAEAVSTQELLLVLGLFGLIFFSGLLFNWLLKLNH